MINDLEAFIAEHKAKLSKEKQETLAEPHTSVNQETGRTKSLVPSSEQMARNRVGGQKKPPTPEEGIAVKLGNYAEKRQKLREESRNDYNRYLDEINYFNKGHPNRRNLSAIPAQEMPSPRSARKESPIMSYAEILQNKRNAEKNYRRHNDPRFYDQNTNLGDANYKRLSTSDGNISRSSTEVGSRMRAREQEFETKKVKFADSSVMPNNSVEFPYNDRARRLDPDNEHYNATLLIGERLNDDHQKKEAYRRDLQRQMAEAKALREREKLESKGILPNASSNQDSERRPTSWPKDDAASRLFEGGGSQTPRAPPQSGLGFLPHNKPINDAYFYYGTKNLLDPTLAAGPDSSAPMVPEASQLNPIVPRTIPSRRGVEPDQRYSARDVAFERSLPGTLGIHDRDEQRKRAFEERKRQYQQELQLQMAEAKIKKQKEKEEKEKYDKKIEEEVDRYNPFGRSGGGAPLKDALGNVDASRYLQSLMNHQPRPVGFPDSQRTPRSDLVLPTSLQPRNSDKSDENFARGGNGIFGEPMSQEQKSARLKYQEELLLQVEEKKLRLKKEREQVKKEDEQLEQKIKEDAAKAAKELEEAAKKEKEKRDKFKHEEMLRNQEVMRRKVLEEELKKKEDAERQRFRQEQQRRDDSTRQQSPPISTSYISQRHRKSPPLPAKRVQSRQSQISNSEVLEHLANFGKKLQVERKNVETDFKRVQSEPEVYDPRLHLLPQNAKNSFNDVFELAKTGRPACVRRLPTSSHPSTSGRLSYTMQNRDDELLQLLSESDTNAKQLERRQKDVLMTQQKEIAELNKENSSRMRADSGSRSPSPFQRPSPNLLHSTTDFMEFPFLADDHSKYIPDDRKGKYTESLAKRPSQQRDTLNELDLGKLGQINDERLKKIRSIRGDDVYNDNISDILDKFMMKQTHRRPPSSDTLSKNSWMLPAKGH